MSFCGRLKIYFSKCSLTPHIIMSNSLGAQEARALSIIMALSILPEYALRLKRKLKQAHTRHYHTRQKERSAPEKYKNV